MAIEKRLKLLYGFLGILIILGIYAAYRVVIEGLGVTNMSESSVWGLWIVGDISFIALAAGAFMTSFILYLLRKKEFEPVIRLAILIGVVGYSMALMTLILDIGRPLRFWYPYAYWQHHSVMAEVCWCIAFYFTILCIELFPVIGEAKRIPGKLLIRRIGRFLHKIMPFLALFGTIFSLMHQTSLGLLYGVISSRPAWYRPQLGLLFLVSAMAAGPALIFLTIKILEKTRGVFLVAKEIKAKLIKISGIVLIVYLFLKVIDLFLLNFHFLKKWNENLFTMYNTNYFTLLCLELLLGVIVPAIIFLHPKLKIKTNWITFASVLVLFGLFNHRWRISVTGLAVPTLDIIDYTKYYPNYIEWFVIIGALSVGVLMFTLAVKYLPILKPLGEEVSKA